MNSFSFYIGKVLRILRNTFPILFITLLLSCTPKSNTSSYIVFSTQCTITLPVNDLTKYFSILYELEDKLSYRRPRSEVARINKNAGKQSVVVSEDTFFLIKEAIRLSHETEGAFNPLILPLVKLWGWDTGDVNKPDNDSIKKALELCDINDIELDEENKTVFLKKEGMGLDLGAIAKGYATDVLFEEFKKDGIKEGSVNIGGNVFVFGDKDYTIALQKPYADRGIYEIKESVRNSAVVTSGAYERSVSKDGEFFHHIIDPETGFSSEEIYNSVSIISESGIIADVYSTAIFIKGDSLKEKFLSLYPRSKVIVQ